MSNSDIQPSEESMIGSDENDISYHDDVPGQDNLIENAENQSSD